MAATLMLLTQEELLKLSAQDLDALDMVVQREIATSPEVQQILRKRLEGAIKSRAGGVRKKIK